MKRAVLCAVLVGLRVAVNTTDRLGNYRLVGASPLHTSPRSRTQHSDTLPASPARTHSLAYRLRAQMSASRWIKRSLIKHSPAARHVAQAHTNRHATLPLRAQGANAVGCGAVASRRLVNFDETDNQKTIEFLLQHPQIWQFCPFSANFSNFSCLQLIYNAFPPKIDRKIRVLTWKKWFSVIFRKFIEIPNFLLFRSEILQRKANNFKWIWKKCSAIYRNFCKMMGISYFGVSGTNELKTQLFTCKTKIFCDFPSALFQNCEKERWNESFLFFQV